MKRYGGVRQGRSSMTDGLVATFEQLRAACVLAMGRGADLWDHAVPVRQLLKARASPADIEQLVRRGYAAFATEISSPARRRFRASRTLTFVAPTCLVLTPAGYAFYRRSSILGRSRNPHGNQADAAVGKDLSWPLVPRWEGDTGCLYLGFRLVKAFRQPARYQRIILEALEEQGWPEFADDPLPQTHGIDAKVRLHDTLKCMNRGQREARIHFEGDGTGQGFHWRVTEAGD